MDGYTVLAGFLIFFAKHSPLKILMSRLMSQVVTHFHDQV